jgi:hypothetical protein
MPVFHRHDHSRNTAEERFLTAFEMTRLKAARAMQMSFHRDDRKSTATYPGILVQDIGVKVAISL